MIDKGILVIPSLRHTTGNTNAISALAITCGVGECPGQMVGRFNGHQRGGGLCLYATALTQEQLAARCRTKGATRVNMKA